MRALVLAPVLVALPLGAPAADPPSLTIEFSPTVASVGTPITFSALAVNESEEARTIHVEIALASGGTLYALPREYAMEAGEEQCAEVTVTPAVPGAITVTMKATVDGQTVADVADLFVAPGGEASPVDDLAAFAEFVLGSFEPCLATPVERGSWGAVKALYR